MDVPAHIQISVIARACGLSPRAARGLIRRAGVLVRDGTRAVAPRALFMERLPDHFQDVHAFYLRRGDGK